MVPAWTRPPVPSWPRPCPATPGSCVTELGWNASARRWTRRGRAGNRLDLATVEATNLHTVSVLVTASALARAESRGCHRWRDIQPVSSGPPGRHTVLYVEEGRVRGGPLRSA